MKLLLCLFGVQLLLSVCRAAVTVLNGKAAVAVAVGSKSTIGCSSNIRNGVAINWRGILGQLIVYSQPDTPCYIYNQQYFHQYNVSAAPDGSYCNLIILNATTDEAGSYTCSDGSGITVDLIVLDSGPQCSKDPVNNTVVHPTHVTMNCSVQYNSSSGWIPSLKWNTTNLVTSGTSGTTAYSTFTYNTGASTPIPSYSCEVGYNSSVFVDIPSCSTNSVNVLWCPIAVNISGASDGFIAPGSSLTCSASGNPSPTYQWFNSTNNLLANGPLLTVWNPDNYTCTASNNANGSLCLMSLTKFVNVTQTTTQKPTTTHKPAETTVITSPSVTSSNGTSSSTVTEHVTGPTPTPTPPPGSCSTDCIIIIVVVGGGSIIIIIIIIAVCCCRRKRTCCFKEPKPKKQTSTDNLTTTTADISYNSHQNPAFDSSVPPPYDSFGPPRGNGGNMGATPVNSPYSYDDDNFDGPLSGNGGNMGAVPVNSPYSYEHEAPAYSSAHANPHVSQRVNGDPKSLYPNRNNPDYTDDAVQYAQLEMDNKPRSRAPLQAVDIHKETEYEFVKRA